MIFALSFNASQAINHAFSPGLLWIIILFISSLGLNRMFVLEKEFDAFSLSISAPVDRGIIFLAKWIRQNSGKHGMGWSFTEGKLNEAKTLTLPNGVKAKIDFKGVTFISKLSKPVFLDRDELLKFFRGSTKYLRYEGSDGAKKLNKYDKQSSNSQFTSLFVCKNSEYCNIFTANVF